MEYIHVRSLEKYHPGYKDRKLVWAKIYFDLVQGDPEFELLTSEVDKWRYVAMVCLELQHQAPLPNDDKYWGRKGFDLKKRPMSLTLKMLQNFLESVTEDEKVCNGMIPVTEASTLPLRNRNVDKIRKEEEKSKRRAESMNELISFCLSLKLSASDGEYLWYKWEANGWMNGSRPIKDWKLTVKAWERAGYLPSQKNSKPNAQPTIKPMKYAKPGDHPDVPPMSPEMQAELKQATEMLANKLRSPAKS